MQFEKAGRGYGKNYIYILSTIAALGGLLFGFDLVIISGTVSSFTDQFQLSDFQTGWAVGCINLGAAAGAALAGKLSDSFGRKRLLIVCALMFAITGIGTGWASSFQVFILFRILSGVAVGTAALVCPMYIAEISPAAKRGKLVSLYQLSIVTGILLAYYSNYILLTSGENNWRWMFSSQAAPSVLFFIGLCFVVESPRWLIGKHRTGEAIILLTRIGGTEYARKEAEQIELSFLQQKGSSLADLFKLDVRRVVFIGIVIALYSQAVGQNSIFSFAPIIFKNAGMAEDLAFLQSIILGLINFIFTFVAIFTIDKLGRRSLLLYGSVFLCMDAAALAVCFYYGAPPYLTLAFVLGFIAIYAATLGPVTWVLLSELFPNRLRGNAMSIATLSLWIANFFSTASFPVMKQNLGLHITFGIHAMICMTFYLFVKKFVPETKKKSLEEIESGPTAVLPSADGL